MSSFFSFTRNLFRSAFRFKTLAAINIIGLALGLAIAMFLLIYLQFEFSYDKHFKDASRIYRMLTVLGEKEIYPRCLETLGQRLEKDIPEVETASRLYEAGNISLYYEKKNTLRPSCFYVDSSFFRIFNFKPIYGKLEGALDAWENCVITRTTAVRFFGEGVDPVGKILNRTDQQRGYQITAVIEDVPKNTHFKFDMLFRLPEFGYYGLEYFTYLKFKAGIDQEQAIIKCNRLSEKMLEERFADIFDGKYGAITEPLLSIHTSTRSIFDLTPTANKTNLMFIIMVVCLILGIVVSNFVSLSLIQGEKQAKEICIRKTNGADRKNIMQMMFRDAYFITFCAFILALVICYFFSSALAHWLNLNLPENVGISWEMWWMFGGMYVVLAFIVGCYPAWYLSKYNPIELVQKSEKRKYKLTATSVVIQFAVVLFCVSSLFIVWRQLDYVRKLPLGFQKDNIMEVNVLVNKQDFPGLKSDLLNYPYIKEVAVGCGNPIAGCSGDGMKKPDQEKWINVDSRRIGPGYLSFYEIPILDGKDFGESTHGGKKEVIISESLAAALAYKNPVGQQVYFIGDEPWTIIGVVKDVIVSAHQKTGNMAYYANTDQFYTLAVKYDPENYQEAKRSLMKVVEDHYKTNAVAVWLTSDIVQYAYWEDGITARILMSGSLLAVLLALLGLFALSKFVTLQKRKEIGLRRTVGAQVYEIIFYLHGYILIRMLPAIPIGVMLSVFVMYRWLQNFEYARTMEWWIFLGSILLTLFIAVVTVFGQTLYAARSNPVDSLKSE